MADRNINALAETLDTDLVDGDYVPIWDASLTTTRKTNFGAIITRMGDYIQENFTGNDTLTGAETGKVCTDIGFAGPGALTLTLPTAAAGLRFKFVRTTAFAFRIKPNTGDSVNGETIDKYVELLTRGTMVLKAYDATTWIIDVDHPSWSVEP